MSAILVAVAEAAGRGIWGVVTGVASIAWLVVIGIPETITHASRFVAWCAHHAQTCRDRVLNSYNHAAVSPWRKGNDDQAS